MQICFKNIKFNQKLLIHALTEYSQPECSDLSDNNFLN